MSHEHAVTGQVERPVTVTNPQVAGGDDEGCPIELNGWRFAMIPEKMLYSQISGTAIKVFGCLLRHGSGPATCHPGHNRIAKLCRLSVATVKRSIAELKASGWLTVFRRETPNGGRISNGYRLNQEPQGYPQEGRGVDDPQVTDEPAPQVTDEPAPRSPVSYEREPVNESKLNDTPLPPVRHQSETPTERAERRKRGTRQQQGPSRPSSDRGMSPAVGRQLRPDEGWDDPTTVFAGLRAARAALGRSARPSAASTATRAPAGAEGAAA